MKIYRKIYRILQDHALTEDLIQESFIKVVTAAPKIQNQTNIKGWMNQIIRNTTIDYLRRDKHHRESVDIQIIPQVWDKEQVDTLDVVEIKMRNQMLYDAINELKPRYRLLLVLYYVEEKTYKEICQQLKITPQNAARRMAWARKTLKEKFETLDTRL